MSLIGNVLWLVFGGLPAAIGYIIGGIGLCVTIIGIPFGIQAFNLGIATLTPFGRHIQSKPRGDGIIAMVFNILWLVTIGWPIALVHLGFGIVLAITIIGIPFATQHFKLIPVALFPFTFKLD